MIDNLPSNQREGGQQTSDSHDFIYEDKRALRLSHYVMAERCMLVEYKTIQDEIREGQSDTLIYIHRGTGYWGPPLRLGAPSEIALLTLTHALTS